jgi:aldehyde dehydrogenase (NAD+)
MITIMTLTHRNAEAVAAAPPSTGGVVAASQRHSEEDTLVMSTEQPVQVRDKLYIGGEWVAPAGSETIDVLNSTTEDVIGSIPEGTAEDVDRAIKAARDAFESWSLTSVGERAGWLQKISKGLGARMEEIAALISEEVGMPIKLSHMIQAGLPTMDFGSMPKVMSEIAWEEEIGNSLIIREPVGVVGAITPWNYPLHQISAKVAPALAAGCTIVVKPSEVAPLNAFLLAEIIDELELPAGVFNLVTGYGPVVGEALAAHPGVDMISFTGSTRAGRRVSEVASATVKKVSLELGGKSPNVILEDAALEQAIADSISKCLLNSGQTCSALTRMLVPRSRLPEAEQIAAAVAEKFTPGDPFSPQTRLGPLVSEQQRERVRSYIRKGMDEGAKLLTGGEEPPEGLERGYFVSATVFSEVTPEMTIAQEEIFGPVLVLMPYEDEDDAVRIANATDYGLAGGVWSGDEEHAKRVARRIRTGQVDINGATFNPVAPFGGYKQSGHGRELGRFGVEEFLQVKSLQL